MAAINVSSPIAVIEIRYDGFFAILFLALKLSKKPTVTAHVNSTAKNTAK